MMAKRMRGGLTRRVAAFILAMMLCIGMLPVEAAAMPGDASMDMFADVSVESSGDDPVEIPVGVLFGERFRMAASVPVQWGDVAGIDGLDGEEGVRTWDVSGTSVRYMEIPVKINVENVTEVEIPYTLDGPGRTVPNGQTYKPVCQVGGISMLDGWHANVDPEDNIVTLTNDGSKHFSITVNYMFDCWNMVSGEMFKLPCTLRSKTGEQTIVLKGAVKTGYAVSMAAVPYDRLFNGFGGVDDSTSYIRHWVPAYEKYFGLTEDQFDAGTEAGYVYDIAGVMVSPTGQQPYDISGEISLSGDGEAVSVLYMMDSYLKPDELCVTTDEFTQTDGGKYGFSIKSNKLVLGEDGNKKYAVVSGLSDGVDHVSYVLYVLARYPASEYDGTANIDLKASLELTHTGLDVASDPGPGAQTCRIEDLALYQGKKGSNDRIYWAGYVLEDTLNPNGLTSLRRGDAATMDYHADFFCLNEARAGFNADAQKTYRMEAVIDLQYLTEGDSYMRLDVGDYKINKYNLSLVDAEGNWSYHDAMDLPRVGWTDDKFGESGAGMAGVAGKTIEVYGSTAMAGDTWVSLGTIPVEDAWAINRDRGFPFGQEYKTNGDYVRLKFVYDSRLTTALRVGYQVSVDPRVKNKLPGVNFDDLTDLHMAGWLKYTGYVKNGDGKWEPDSSVMREYLNPSDPTCKDVAEYDSSTPASIRNVVKTTLGNSADAAGMLVTQALYDSNGSLEGASKDNAGIGPSSSFAKKTDVNNVSEVVYSVTGALTNGSSTFEGLKAYIDKLPQESAYRSSKMRYYVFLPDGLKLNTNPDGVESPGKLYCYKLGSTAYLSSSSSFYNGDSSKAVHLDGSGTFVENVPVSDGRITGYNEFSWGNLSEMYWRQDGIAKVSEDSNGQLYVFERELPAVDTTWDSRFNMWYSTTYYRGGGLSFSVVPERGTGTLPAGNYDVKFWCQFLDGNGDPISVKDFVPGGYETNLGELESVSGRTDLDPDTLLYIPSGFTNDSALGGSVAYISVGRGWQGSSAPDGTYGDKVELELGDNYSYELEYMLNSGSSEDVVLWSNIEPEPETADPDAKWRRGTVCGVDLNGNESVRVYVRESEFEEGEYVDASVDSSFLTKENGWIPVDDPLSYDGWSEARAVAFHFDGTKFGSVNDGRKSVKAYVKMKAEIGDDAQGVAEPTTYKASSRILFSDAHMKPGTTEVSRACTSVNSVDVQLTVLPGFALPKTGGTGTAPFVVVGSMAVLLAGLALIRKKRRV